MPRRWTSRTSPGAPRRSPPTAPKASPRSTRSGGRTGPPESREAASPTGRAARPFGTGVLLPSVRQRWAAGATGRRVELRSDLFGALVRDPGEQGPDLALAVAAVAAERADGRELAGLRPTRDRLGVDAEHRRDLSGREQRLGVR